ncbi:MAG TPA: D-2-hydroxyacid dehydrogenase family protein [Anaerolineales bacterium]|jgi:phosphoglycerate dehydrogenase-like enzyme|nr:D-2-hydroxyacid dehydrogenase family protein [Anaerolineales bacterium]
MNKLNMIVLDDYEGELANAPAMQRLRQLADVQVLNRPIHPEEYDTLKDSQVLLALRERTKLNAPFFSACPNLELVLQTGGHAYHVDQTAATQRGIVIALGRRVSKPTVVIPELVFSLLLGLVRQIYPLTTEMRQGGWPGLIGGSLSGRTLGILGYGRLGHPVARLAEAFGMKVVAWDRTSSSSGTDSFGVERLPLDDLLAISDVVSIHLRLSEHSRGLLNREKLWKMKQGAILINTSRGAIVDEAALIEALRENRLAGAGLDVFSTEPLPPTSELRTLPNVLLTPHVGWKVRDVLHEFVEIAADQLEAWLTAGLSKSDVLNPAAIEVERARRGTLIP